jgi:hypothetical protein
MTFRDLAQTHLMLVFFAACVVLVWVVVNYTYPADVISEFPNGRKKSPPRNTGWLIWVATRSLIAAALIGWMSGWNFWFGLWTFVLCLSLPVVRSRIVSTYLAETEILGNLTFGLGLVLLAHCCRVAPALRPPSYLSTGQLSTVFFTTAIFLWVLRGGTYVVRGILEKGRILPAISTADIHLDIEEYNRGRIIGNIERLILVTFVAIQAYPALAFLMAAKGLFRAKDLEKKEFSEYFLVGTLVSSLVAIVAGLLVQFVIQMLW